MEIIPLGSNGFFPSFGRETACYAISFNNVLILLDAGSGLYRLLEEKNANLLDQAKEVHLFLSHYHLDHTFGLFGASEIMRKIPVRVFAQSGEQIFSGAIKTTDFPNIYSRSHSNFSWHEVTSKMDLPEYKVFTRKQYHRGTGSLAYRFSFGLTYITDSESGQESVDFAKNSTLLLHEHTFTGEEIYNSSSDLYKQNQGGHVTTLGAAMIAVEARVKRLTLIHHYPFYKEEMLNKQLNFARQIFPETSLALDNEKISY